MVFSEAEDDGIDLASFPGVENEDEEDNAEEEVRQRGRPVCFSFEDHEWSDQRSDIEIPEFREQQSLNQYMPVRPIKRAHQTMVSS